MVTLWFSVFVNLKFCLVRIILFVWRIQPRKEEKTQRCQYTGICRRGKFDQCLAKSDQAFYLFLCNKIIKFVSFKFGYLLDENAGSKFDNIGMNAMANRDNASKYMLQIAHSCNAILLLSLQILYLQRCTFFNWNTHLVRNHTVGTVAQHQ